MAADEDKKFVEEEKLLQRLHLIASLAVAFVAS